MKISWLCCQGKKPAKLKTEKNILGSSEIRMTQNAILAEKNNTKLK